MSASFQSGQEQGLKPVVVQTTKHGEFKVYYSSEAESYFCEFYLTKMLPVLEMTDLVNAACKAAEQKGLYVLNQQLSFVEIAGIRSEFELRYVRW